MSSIWGLTRLPSRRAPRSPAPADTLDREHPVGAGGVLRGFWGLGWGASRGSSSGSPSAASLGPSPCVPSPMPGRTGSTGNPSLLQDGSWQRRTATAPGASASGQANTLHTHTPHTARPATPWPDSNPQDTRTLGLPCPGVPAAVVGVHLSGSSPRPGSCGTGSSSRCPGQGGGSCSHPEATFDAALCASLQACVSPQAWCSPGSPQIGSRLHSALSEMGNGVQGTSRCRDTAGCTETGRPRPRHLPEPGGHQGFSLTGALGVPMARAASYGGRGQGWRGTRPSWALEAQCKPGAQRAPPPVPALPPSHPPLQMPPGMLLPSLPRTIYPSRRTSPDEPPSPNPGPRGHS